MALNQATIRSQIINGVIAFLKANTSVKVTNSFTSQTTQLPQIVVTTPQVANPRTKFGNSVNARDFEIEMDIEIYANKKKDVVTLLDQIAFLIEQNCETLNMIDVDIGLSNDASFDLEGKNVHVQVLPLTFKPGEIQ